MVRRILIFALALAMLTACGSPSTQTPVAAEEHMQGLKIVASTSWVGAFAVAAGAEDVSIIAPSSIQHPPDYDPKPSDLEAISGADYVLYAGFEGFAAKMQEAVGGSSDKLITVATENSPEAIHKEVTRLGELFGTQDKAAAFLASFDAEYAALSEEVKAAVGDHKPVVVNQLFVTPWVFFAGLESAGTYGPMPMTPDELKTLSDKQPTLIFENYHMGGGDPIVEATGATKIDLINFPGDDMDLLSVFRTNAETLKTAFASTGSQMVHAAATPFDVSVAQYFMDTAGFHGMAETLASTKTIDASYASTVNRVKKVLEKTAWPEELHEQADAFIVSLGDFATALSDDKVDDAITLSETVHDAQHELSHAIDEWAVAASATTAEADPFNVSVAQYFLDSAGFHGMAETLAETKTIDSTYPSKVSRVLKVLSQTTWPSELNEQAQALIVSLADFSTALSEDKVDDAITLSETVHDAQHELSHAIDEWMATAKPATTDANPFQVSVAQYFLDTAGFHGMAETLAETKVIDASYPSKVSRVLKVLTQTTWPSELNEQAQALIVSLGDFSTALSDDKVDDAVALSESVHDAQHELSHAIDEWMGSDHAENH